MSVFIEDTARNNLASWTIEAAGTGAVQGAVLSPFSTPRHRTSYKQSARETVNRIQEAGREAWFDAETHALQMPAVGDYRYYDDWPLWASGRGQLASPGDIRSHVELVFATQDDLGVPHLAPTVLLHSPQSATSRLALQMAEAAVELNPSCALTIAGDASFWAGGSLLDAHIGAMAQLEPGAWRLTVVRALTVLPAPAMPEEIHGLARTARALSENAVVQLSHGDLAALPAVAAGATVIGVKDRRSSLDVIARIPHL